MPILMLLEAPGMTIDQYRAVNETMGIRSDDDAPDGLISHTAGRTEDGVLAVDVWESQEHLDRFFEERLGQALAAAGLGGAAPRILPVHNLIAKGAGGEPGVIVLIEVEGFGPDVYDEMLGSMPAHVADGSGHPAISHTAAKTDTGMLDVDVWESAEAFGSFAESQVGPAGAAAGLGPIEPRFVPVVNRMRGPKAR